MSSSLFLAVAISLTLNFEPPVPADGSIYCLSASPLPLAQCTVVAGHCTFNLSVPDDFALSGAFVTYPLGRPKAQQLVAWKQLIVSDPTKPKPIDPQPNKAPARQRSAWRRILGLP